jgi:hypothetical protein
MVSAAIAGQNIVRTVAQDGVVAASAGGVLDQ